MSENDHYSDLFYLKLHIYAKFETISKYGIFMLMHRVYSFKNGNGQYRIIFTDLESVCPKQFKNSGNT